MTYSTENIASLFDSIAPQYDKLNPLMSLGIDCRWRRKAVREIVDVSSPLSVLDVATGTGDFLAAIAKKSVPESQLTGVDLSEKMLEVARQKLPASIYLEVGNVEKLRFPDNSFDRVSVAFGIRNFNHLEQGLSEMCRVLRPAGKLVILELSYPDNPFLLLGYKCYAFHILPFWGSLLAGNREAYSYLPASIMKFPKPDVMIPKLKSAGFSSVSVRRFSAGICLMYVAEK